MDSWCQVYFMEQISLCIHTRWNMMLFWISWEQTDLVAYSWKYMYEGWRKLLLQVILKIKRWSVESDSSPKKLFYLSWTLFRPQLIRLLWCLLAATSFSFWYGKLRETAQETLLSSLSTGHWYGFSVFCKPGQDFWNLDSRFNECEDYEFRLSKPFFHVDVPSIVNNGVFPTMITCFFSKTILSLVSLSPHHFILPLSHISSFQLTDATIL